MDSNAQEIKIEVKATGKNNSQYFTDKDIQADYIIWLDFGDLFENNSTSNISVYILQPKLLGLKSQKIDLKRLGKFFKDQPLQKQNISLSKYGFC